MAPTELGEGADESAIAEAAAGRIAAWREETRDARIAVAREAERRFGRKVSWGAIIGERAGLFTHVAVPMMTRLRQPQRQVLDTLVEAGVARSRSDALKWCVKLVRSPQRGVARRAPVGDGPGPHGARAGAGRLTDPRSPLGPGAAGWPST